ncbi:LysR family transcriptional regulator [Legionella hackeliae]|uniref:Putative Transcriptional regulator, LysR family n=1 Tax=Legionella hackeliae TaxID=449 RepID=A0A0A8URJ0_LEGHA|nr:LysR family transcriptional regulator [Legionella hackeliae]KTD13201.1 LysR family transcriptional regulator [Legionella hackeliae]CEK11485.1 putative Transcriptional regulator, LysR family [Legionella hackeliae]STX48254.1 LysR family transcriptional regulator [Legionella hackeliae]
MSLSSSQLDAFFAVANCLNFTKAAQSLCITQSALSQRISKLEQKLGHLFVRNTKSICLTNAGHQLFRYCLKKNALENECLEQISTNNKDGLCGIVRIGGISTALRFYVLDALSQLLIKNCNIKLELIEMEARDLPGALGTNLVDFIVSTDCVNNKFIEAIQIGVETYILAESAACTNNVKDVYLDHDIQDEITHIFLQQQDEKPPTWRQHYLDNIHLIIEAVKLGIGRAVLPYQVLAQEPQLRQVANMESLSTSLYLMFYKQDYYTHLQQTVIDALAQNNQKESTP